MNESQFRDWLRSMDFTTVYDIHFSAWYSNRNKAKVIVCEKVAKVFVSTDDTSVDLCGDFPFHDAIPLIQSLTIPLPEDEFPELEFALPILFHDED